MKIKVTSFKESGKYYTEDEVEINTISPSEMDDIYEKDPNKWIKYVVDYRRQLEDECRKLHPGMYLVPEISEEIGSLIGWPMLIKPSDVTSAQHNWIKS